MAENEPKIVCESDPQWTQHDTDMCIEGERSGTAVWIETGKPINLDDLHVLGSEYDLVRNEMTPKEFLKLKGIGSMPMNFSKK